MPGGEELPAPTDRYFEIETAKLHGGWAQWDRIAPQERGELIAHEMVKNMRDHYYFDKRSEKLKQDEPDLERPKQTAPWEQIKSRFFGGAPSP